MSNWIIGLIIFTVVSWMWIAYEIYNAPLMPGDFDLNDEERELWRELTSKHGDDEKNTKG
jgi:hypothetical protein